MITPPHYNLEVRKSAQDKLENDSTAFIDYLVSCAIKKYNITNKNKNHIVLVHGGKAFCEYVEKLHRPDSFDWDVKIFIENSVTHDEMMNISAKVTEKLSSFINLQLSYMQTIPYLLHKLLSNCQNLDGYPNILKNIDPHMCVPKTYAGRRKADSGGVVDYVCLTLNVGGPINILSLIETLPISESPDIIKSYYRAVNNETNIAGIILDNKRFLVPYTYLKSNIKALIKEPTYPKKDKAKMRLQILESAEKNGFLNCQLQTIKNKCNIVYDFTEEYSQLAKIQTIMPQHLQADFDFLSNNDPKYLNAIVDYSGNAYRDVNASLLYAHFYKKTLNETFADNPGYDSASVMRTINNLDECFNEMSNRNLQLEQPLIVFRNTGFVVLSMSSAADSVNLYNILPGQVMENITYLSTTYTNKNKAMQDFANDSQFRGCLFKITIRSTKGICVIGDKSLFPDEKEVLLDRRGKLLVTNVSYGYGVEKHKTLFKFLERLFIECDYYPPGEITPPANIINNVIAVDYKNRQITDPRTEYGDAQESDVDLYRSTGVNVFDRRDPINVVNDIRLLIELHTNGTNNTDVKIDTIFGTISVNAEAASEILHLSNDVRTQSDKKMDNLATYVKGFDVRKFPVNIALAIMLVVLILIIFIITDTHNKIYNIIANYFTGGRPSQTVK